MESTSALQERSPQARCHSELPTVKLMVVNKEAQLMQTGISTVSPHYTRIVLGWPLCLIITNV